MRFSFMWSSARNEKVKNKVKSDKTQVASDDSEMEMRS